jgi:hypothetical protein
LLDHLSEGSRLFMILLATVYAGELLWRERELRVSSLVCRRWSIRRRFPHERSRSRG